MTSASPEAGRTFQVGGSRMNSDRVERLEAPLAGAGARDGPSPMGSLAWLLSARGWYFVSIGLVSLALALTLTLQQITVGRPSLFLFFAAIVASAWLGGTGAGLLAAALSVPAGAYFYSIQVGTIAIGVDNIAMLVFFGVCAAAGGILNARQRSITETLRRTHHEVELKAAALQSANDNLTAQVQERQRAEGALREAQAELLRISRLTTIGQLSASIAHEVSQPLTAVISNASSCVRWLDTTPPNLAEAKLAAQRIVRDSERASAIITNIRTMVRRGLPEKSCVDLNEVLTSVLELTQREREAAGVSVVADLSADLPSILGDSVQLQQLFLNLMMNALEAIDEMDLTTSRPRSIRIGTAVQDGQIVVDLEDSGPGISAEVAGRQFEAFVSTKPNGMGLGLSICRTIVEGHGGSIESSVTSGSGAIFRVSIPCDGCV